MPKPNRGPRALRDALVAAAGLAVGLGAFAVVADDGASSGPRTDDRASVADLPFDASAGAVAPSAAGGEPAPAGAASAVAAVETFLRAEVDGDAAASYALLDARSREGVRSLARWIDAHGTIPPVEGFEVTGATEAAPGRVEVHAELRLEPRLDEIVGLFPARASATIPAVREHDTWRVAFDDAQLRAQHPADDGARAVVARWASARRECAAGEDEWRALEWEGGLVGLAADADAAQLCDARGDVRVGAPVGLDDAYGTEPLFAAFGPDASEWARVVPVESPRRLGVVAAPLGDQWIVVGVVEVSPAGSG